MSDNDIEYVQVKKEDEMSMEGVTIKRVFEDNSLIAVFLKNEFGQTYKIALSSYSLRMYKPKPLNIKKYKVIFKLNNDIVNEYICDSKEQAREKKSEIENKHSNSEGFSCEIEESEEEIQGILNEAL